MVLAPGSIFVYCLRLNPSPLLFASIEPSFESSVVRERPPTLSLGDPLPLDFERVAALESQEVDWWYVHDERHDIIRDRAIC